MKTCKSHSHRDVDDVFIGWSTLLDCGSVRKADAGQTAADLVFAGDKALYCAKLGGRAQARLIDRAVAGAGIDPRLARDPIVGPAGNHMCWN